MVNRSYNCPLCNSAFRNESGMKWHIAHRHEIPNAFDALGKDYETRITNLHENNSLLEKKVEHLERELAQTKIALLQEQTKRLEDNAEILKLNRNIQKAIIGIAGRDVLIKQRLNIDMPNPFGEQD